MRRFLFSLLLRSLALSAYAQAPEDNMWTKTTTGNWEDPYWSTGMLPNSNSTVWFTNAGYKALALGPSTRAFPDSLTIHDLTVSSPTGSVNTLLLNFLGVLTPLKAGVVWVETNSTVLSLNSRMELWSGMVVDGMFQFGQFSEL